jgi:hypothetical protein
VSTDYEQLIPRQLSPTWKGKYFVSETYKLRVFEVASKTKGSAGL